MSTMRWVVCSFLMGLAMIPAPAASVLLTVDNVPAATLLLPFFEVSCAPDGITTMFSVNNASATAVLAHVVVWSDLSVPVLDFNIYLTGYDAQSVNLQSIFCNGNLPRTASVGQDPQDTISPRGDFSQDINFASCTGQLPPPPLPANFVQHLQLSLTGKSSPILGNRCAGRDLGDNIMRGYATVDTVNNCTLRFPGDAGYFPAGTGDVTNQNVLWGDWVDVNPGGNMAFGEPLVHIEADATNPETSVPGEYTFYGRYVGWNASDNREPLATSFSVRYAVGGAFDGGTDYIVWRDSKVNQAPFTCPVVAGTRPTWFPLGQEEIVIFDEDENPDVPATFPVSPQPPQQGIIPFPAETQRVTIGGAAFPVPFNFGWIHLNLNFSSVGNPNPPEDPDAAQAWVVDPSTAQGKFEVSAGSNQGSNASNVNHGKIKP